MELAIVPTEVIGYLSDVFNAIWPILAVGLGITAVPLLVRAAKSAISHR